VRKDLKIALKMDTEQQNIDETSDKDKESAVSYDDALAQAGKCNFN
jgi:hypothetical protein